MDKKTISVRRALLVILILICLVSVVANVAQAWRFHNVRRTYVEDIYNQLFLLHQVIYNAKDGVQRGDALSLTIYNRNVVWLSPHLMTLLEGLYRHHGQPANVDVLWLPPYITHFGSWNDMSELLWIDVDDVDGAEVLSILAAMSESVIQAMLDLSTTDELIPHQYGIFERHPNRRISTRRLFEIFSEMTASLMELRR